MARPRDYGDPYPSDIGDQPPGNPTSNFGEVDYTPSTAAGGGFGKGNTKPGDNIPFVPDPNVDRSKKPKRSDWTAVVLRKTSPNGRYPVTYQILRQDGKRGIATTEDISGVYSDLRAGQRIQVEAGQEPNRFIIVGAPQPFELQVCELGIILDQVTDTEITIPFNQTRLTIGDLGKAADLIAGGVRVNHGAKQMLYEVTYNVEVECIEPDGSDGTILIDNECVTNNYTHDIGDPPISVPRLRFDKMVGFRVVKDGDCTYGVRIASTVAHSMPWAPDVGEDDDGEREAGDIILWGTDPFLGGSITQGTQRPQGWLKVTNIGQTKRLWLGHGDQKLRLRFPNNLPSGYSHLVVVGISGECVQLEWTPEPGTGYIYVMGCNYTCYRYRVHAGLLISGPGLQGYSTQEAVCDAGSRTTMAPCPGNLLIYDSDWSQLDPS